ncbi:hypothetical protein MKW94_004455, partial [Papaver nudicaule]|nr:hypothetical protein [Papaver nudicaule]
MGGILSLFNCLRITDPKEPIVDHEMSSSKSTCESVKGSHEHVIEGYSSSKGMGVGKFMTSAKFTVAGNDWVIRFYPDGNDKEHISVHIKLVTPGEVRAKCELKLLDQSGKGIHRLHTATNTFKTEEPFWY